MAKKIPLDVYETEITRLQVELVKMQEWVRSSGARVAVLFEGRDAAGTIAGSGIVNTGPNWLLNLSAMSRVTSTCCFWSCPTGTTFDW